MKLTIEIENGAESAAAVMALLIGVSNVETLRSAAKTQEEIDVIETIKKAGNSVVDKINHAVANASILRNN